MLRRETEQSLEQLKGNPSSTTISPVTRDRADIYAEIQLQVSQFLPAIGRKSVVVCELLEIYNTRILQKWLEARLKLEDCGSVVYRFKFLASAANSDHIARMGLEAYETEDWNFNMTSSISIPELGTDRISLIRFSVLQDKRRKALKQGTEKADTATLRVASAYHAKPDYIVRCEIRNKNCFDEGELGMTQKRGHFERRVLRPSQLIAPGSDRLDSLLFREAESQFLRMLPVGKKAKVVEVEYIDNGDLNVQYCEKKKAFTENGEGYKEFFVFHGTDEVAISKIVKEGFRIGGEGITIKHGAVYGRGIYTVEDPSVAMSYASTSKVILCRVICSTYGEDYNTGARNDIFVIKTKEQIVPQYVIRYATL
jgi:hypothetical protein